MNIALLLATIVRCIVGSLSGAPDGQSLSVLECDTDSGAIKVAQVVTNVSGTTYFQFSPDDLSLIGYVGNKTASGKRGSIVAFDWDGYRLGAMRNIAQLPCETPCHIALLPNSSIATASYTSRTVCFYHNWELKSAVLSDAGTGPCVDRQFHAYAHCVFGVPKCDLIGAVNLGCDRLHFFDTNLKEQFVLNADAGDGPRHAIFSKDGKFLFVVNELSSSVTAYRWNFADSKRIGKWSTLPKDANPLASKAAAIKLSDDGKLLMVSNRGVDSIAFFDVLDDGSLKLRNIAPLKGKFPRDFALFPDEKFMIVGHKLSNEIQVYAFDRQACTLTAVGAPIPCYRPLCFQFAFPKVVSVVNHEKYSVVSTINGASEATMRDVVQTLRSIATHRPWSKIFLVGRAGSKLKAIVDQHQANRGWQRAMVEWVDDGDLESRVAAWLGPKPKIVSLDGAWNFKRELIVTPENKEVESDVGWEKVEVPHDWSIRFPFPANGHCGSGKLPWKGTGRYRRTFLIAESMLSECARGGKVMLEFDGVMARPEVSVNGKKAGGWDYGYMSFAVDATSLVKAGENKLEVFCDTRSHRSRWYPGGGIYRSVRMKLLPRDHVVPYSVAITTPEISPTKAKVNVAYVSSVRGPVEYSFYVENPRLWDVDDPFLYEVEICGETFKYGICSIKWTADDGFHLNGRRVQLKGVNLHADMGPLGMAFNRSVMRRQLEKMRAMGANALRTSHNAPDPQVLELCDELGILVWDECFDKWDGTAGRLDSENVEEYIGRNLVQFVKRDRNHPSVIMWSQSNEIAPATAENYSGLTRERCALFRKLMLAEDVTRPIGCGNVHHTVCSRFIGDRIHADLDITGWNYNAGYREPHELYPEMPLVYSESASAVSSFGAYENPPARDKHDWPKVEGDVSAYDHNCGPDIPDMEFDRIEKDRYCAGEFVWTGIDYLGEPYPYTPSYLCRGKPQMLTARSSYYGICDLNAYPKDRYWLYRSYWKPEAYTLHILPHWNWVGKEGENVPVYVYTNGDEAELFLNGRSLGRRRKGVVQLADATKNDFRKNKYFEICDKYRLRWLSVPYESGELKVVAYRDGQRLGEKVMKTAGKPVRVKLTPESTLLPADGKSVVFVEVDVVDAVGVRDPLSMAKIAVKLEGPGDLLSVSNGDARDLNSFVSFASYPLYYGKAFVTLRRHAASNSPISLTVSCGSLIPNTITFK